MICLHISENTHQQFICNTPLASNCTQNITQNRAPWGCLHVRFRVQLCVQIRVRFADKVIPQVYFLISFSEMCRQTIVIGDRWRSKSLFGLNASRTRNRAQNCTRTLILLATLNVFLSWVVMAKKMIKVTSIFVLQIKSNRVNPMLAIFTNSWGVFISI
jgi:hypothetical protein